jgi:hypothetical protein
MKLEDLPTLEGSFEKIRAMLQKNNASFIAYLETASNLDGMLVQIVTQLLAYTKHAIAEKEQSERESRELTIQLITLQQHTRQLIQKYTPEEDRQTELDDLEQLM